MSDLLATEFAASTLPFSCPE